MPDPYVIGLTGGIASGKSAVAREFEALGIGIVDADAIAREVVAPGTGGLAAILAAFGPAVLHPDGTLDRAAVRRRVFDDAAARRSLEAIVHPRVRSEIQQRCNAAAGAYVVAAVPLLAEGGGRVSYPYLARILVVDVPVAVQRERLIARDGIDPGLADRMISAQSSRRQRLAIADDVIVNTGAIESLRVAVAAVDHRYRALRAGDGARST